MEEPAGQAPVGPMYGRLMNADRELSAEGSCWLDEQAGTATMEPVRDAGMLQKERGALTLELSSGQSVMVTDRPMIFRLGQPDGSNQNARRIMYRLRLINQAEPVEVAQDANAVGATGEGAPTPERETPAAR